MTFTKHDLEQLRAVFAAPALEPTCDKRCAHGDCDFIKAIERRINDEAMLARGMIESLMTALEKAWTDNEKAKNARVPTELFCPRCDTKHVDLDKWAHEIAHRKHLCAQCGHIWAPYDVGTVGVAYGHPTLPIVEYIDVLNRDIAWVKSEWGCTVEENAKLEKRRDELLQIVADLSQTVPLESEVGEALNQRGALLAEVGTLRARVAELEKQLAQKSNTQGSVDMRTEYDGNDYG